MWILNLQSFNPLTARHGVGDGFRFTDSVKSDTQNKNKNKFFATLTTISYEILQAITNLIPALCTPTHSPVILLILISDQLLCTYVMVCVVYVDCFCYTNLELVHYSHFSSMLYPKSFYLSCFWSLCSSSFWRFLNELRDLRFVMSWAYTRTWCLVLLLLVRSWSMFSATLSSFWLKSARRVPQQRNASLKT